jgi:hypothetical protein
MKRMLLFIMVLGVLGQGLAATKTDTSAKKKEPYVQKADKEIQNLTGKVKSLQERSEASGVKTRQEVDGHLKDLREVLEAARKKFNDLYVAIVNVWESLRMGFDRMLADVKGHSQKAVSATKAVKK